MAWSIFTDGGGPGAAATWAIDLLKGIGAPVTKGNEQFIFDWELSEGGGGKFNPLNQGPVPGDASLTTTGQQYGGGAADYASWSAGLLGAEDYLNMPNFSAIKTDLQADDPAGARSALIASPWASSHYGGGASFATAPLPGETAALTGFIGGFGGAASSAVSAAASGAADVTGLSGVTSELKTLAILVPAVLAGAGLVVLGLVRMTGAKQHVENAARTAAEGAALA